MNQTNTDQNNTEVFRDTQDMLNTAQHFHRAGKLQEAEDLYRKILDQEPHNPDATHLMGLVALQVGKLELSREFLNTAIELKDNDPVYYANLSTVYYMQNDREKAKELLNQALKLAPNYADAHANLGILLKEEDNMEESRQHLATAINLGIREVDTITTLAQVNLNLGNLDKAENLAQSAYEMNQEQMEAYEIMVRSLCAQNRPMEAISWGQALKDRAPEYPANKELLDMAYTEAGLPELAEFQDLYGPDMDAD